MNKLKLLDVLLAVEDSAQVSRIIQTDLSPRDQHEQIKRHDELQDHVSFDRERHWKYVEL